MSLAAYGRYGTVANKLSSSIVRGHVSHGYIFEGDYNVDKVGFAKAFAKALLCETKSGEGCDSCLTCRKIDSENYEDLYVLQPEGEEKKDNFSIKVKAIEELQANLMNKPTAGPRNLAIISYSDAMTSQAQNRFLKTLEEPAPGTVIMLLTENVDNLLQTIRSRAVTYRLYDLTAGSREGMAGEAEKVLTMVGKKAFFFDITKQLDDCITNRQEANAFLDGMEYVLGEWVRQGNDLFRRNQLIYGVECVEEARRAISRNGSIKYAIRNLILKLEDSKW